jgi:NADPH:quinone reductase-like Zn-dependent oxidoreductase
VRAARLHAYGPPDVLGVDDVERPAARPRDVVIEVHAAAVNPIDWKIRRGYQQAVIHYDLPHTLGLDASGVVVAVGPKVRRFSVGDEVYTSPTHRRPGTYAEYVAVDERAVARKPKGLTHEQAAGIPLAGLTAYKALVEVAEIRLGQKVFIQAGAGGVGSLAIQIAKQRGCEVATTCSARNADLVSELGADRVIDYRTEAYDEVLRDYDAVLDSLGGEHKERYRKVLRKGGIVSSIVNDIPELVKNHGPYLGMGRAVVSILGNMLGARLAGRRYAQVVRRPDGAALERLTHLVEDGAIQPLVDRVFPLEDIVEAHRYSESGRARGKIIIAVR